MDMVWDDLDPRLNVLTKEIIAAALQTHSDLGPGILEKAYQLVLAKRLSERGLRVEVEAPVPLRVDGLTLDVAYRIDLLVERQVAVEVKAVDGISKAHLAQAMTYLKLGGYPVARILNFHAPHLRQGIRRVVHSP